MRISLISASGQISLGFFGFMPMGVIFSPFIPFFLAWIQCLPWPSLTPPPSQSVVFSSARKKGEKKEKQRAATVDLDMSSKLSRCQGKKKKWQFGDLIQKVFHFYLIQKVWSTYSIQGALTSEIKRRWNYAGSWRISRILIDRDGGRQGVPGTGSSMSKSKRE